MNYIFISPSFPSNFKHFAIWLKIRGVKVLGVGTEPYGQLDPELKKSMTEYFRVGNMESYDEMLRACAYLTYKYGKIDRIESHNEHWLVQDAKLRTDFNVFGYKADEIGNVKLKSRMKELFRNAGVPTIRGNVVRTKDDALALIDEVGFPVCAKPDSGVGAADTYKIRDMGELDVFLSMKPDVEYMMEEFIEGRITTYDGLVDRDGNIRFSNSFIYHEGVMEIVNEDLDVFYHTERDIAPDVVELGKRSVDAFNLRERFFHMEFFRKESGELVALEINVRPPGGLSMDMFNFANDVNLYDQYAKLVASNTFDAVITRPYFCAYVGIKEGDGIKRKHAHKENMETYGQMIVNYGPVASILSKAMGNYSYLLRSQDFGQISEAVRFIMERV